MIQSPPQDLRRVIGFAGGTALIVGITIGSGIFRTPPTIAGLVPNPLVIMGLWTAFGLISICGALAVAELSTLLPEAGGVYVFLREAYGDAAAFVFGWLYVLVTTPTAVASLATVFAEFLLNLLGIPAGVTTVQLIAIAAIVTLTGANVLGARVGAAVSEVTTLVKVTALAAIILGAFLLGHGSDSNFTEGGTVHGGGLARAVAAVIWTYDGWIAVSMIAGEVIAPEQLMKRIIIVGMLVIVTLYIGANLAYLYIMPVGVMAQQKGGDRADGADGDCGTRRRRAHHARDHDEHFRRAQRQPARQAARPLRDGARRPDFLLPRQNPSALGHAVDGAADPGGGRDQHGPHPPGFRFAHDLLRGRRVGGPDLCRRRRVRAAAKDGGTPQALPHACLSVGAAVLCGWHRHRSMGNRLGRDSGRQLRADLRPRHCGGRIPRSLPVETIAEEPVRNVVVTEQAPKPVGPYSQAVIEGDFIFVAGQGPINPLTGKLELGDVRSETKRVFENLRAILQAAGLSLDHVVKCNVYLRDINDFAAMNEVYATYFTAPFPARTTIQAGALPGGIAVEIECIAKKAR